MPGLTVIMIDPDKQTEDSLKSRVSKIISKIKEGIELAKLNATSEQDVIYFVLCPEYTFVKHPDDKSSPSYDKSDRDYIDRKFLKLSKEHPCVYFFPGTGMFQKSRFDVSESSKLKKYKGFLLGVSMFKLDSRVEQYPLAMDADSSESELDRIKSDLGKFATSMPAKNTTTIYHDGTIIGRYSKKYENIGINCSGHGKLFTSHEPAPLFYSGQSKSIFELEGGTVRLGIEICADHNSKALASALSKDESIAPLDIHLILSNTIDINPYKVAHTPGHRSIVINCAGFFSKQYEYAKYSTGVWLFDDDSSLTRIPSTHEQSNILIFSGIELLQHQASNESSNAAPSCSNR